MLFRCASFLALAAASSLALAAAAQTPPQRSAYPPSNTTDTGASSDMQSQPSTSAEPSESTEPSGATTSPMPSARQGMTSRTSRSSQPSLDAALQHAAVACDTELRTYCSNTASGNGQVLSCLNSHRADASAQCQMALDRVQASYTTPYAAKGRHHVRRHKAAMHHMVHHRKAMKHRT